MMRLILTSIFFLSSASVFALELPKATCNESVFTPCICASKSPKNIKYRPKFKGCGGKAAVILSGEYANSFSVVLRDRQNRDRFPATGFNGCSAAEAALGLARCSAYKCQKSFRSNGKYTCCFGGAGTDRVLSKVSRLTIKLKDVPQDKTDPLVRVCLPLFSPIYKMN